MRLIFGLAGLSLLALATPIWADTVDNAGIKAKDIFPKVIAWRRDIHEHPELSGREERTSALVADHLRKLGLEVRTNVGGYGVVGLLKGAKPGKVVALRADMDALPVTEEVDLPFASKVKATLAGQPVGVMHACGHDTHTAILMGVAEILAGMRDQIAGEVKFIFQAGEEGVPDADPAKIYGARAMIAQGALDNPKPQAIFGLHVGVDQQVAGTLSYRPGAVMASSDHWIMRVEGRSTHGAMPWQGIDPIVVSAQIILGFQTIISRQSNIGKEPAVLTTGLIKAGNRNNIIPDRADLEGTLRTFDEAMRSDIKRRMALTASKIAEASEAKASLSFAGSNGVTFNDPALTAKMVPTLERSSPGKVVVSDKQMPAEDFSAYQAQIPGLFFFLSVAPEDGTKLAPNHSPRFLVNEAALEVGVRSMVNLTLDYLAAN